MDVYPRTDFPDIRKKCKVRFYMEMPAAAAAAAAAPGEVTPERVGERLDAIFRPYRVDIAETSWFSAYSIGQRLADRFTRDHRVFLTGDACHTHSPKAGQGTNVSLQDGYNVGWKLTVVLRGRARPSVLETYEHGYSTEDFQEYFIKSGRYTAGLATRNEPSLLVRTGADDDLARGVKPGMRFPSAHVVRFSDAKAMQLSRAIHADSRWYLVIFPGDAVQHRSNERLHKLADNLEVILKWVTASGTDITSFLNPLPVLKSDRKTLDDKMIPSIFTPHAGKWKVKCLQNIFVDDESYHTGHGEAYSKYGIDPDAGAMVLVRPDQCELIAFCTRQA
ncbi:FAD-dependent monooxygenase terD [Colletotrichum shisoi]|uniref:FAD-dependent monooxygenase terD n=1 Tax=Colletotrichum shisoi TaxID=2078593 RepID=A0A5Q4BW34_9PEZI|nr:FAD-dependent monooxygenase terD [Colletotrichum shisoi]